MGITDGTPMSDQFDGAIEDDDSPAGRIAVSYGGDSLFDSPAQIAVTPGAISGGGAGVADAASDAAMEDDDGNGMASLLSGGGSNAALLAYLEDMAAQIEAQSGEPEIGIRNQIAQLRGVLNGRPEVSSVHLNSLHVGKIWSAAPPDSGACRCSEQITMT